MKIFVVLLAVVPLSLAQLDLGGLGNIPGLGALTGLLSNLGALGNLGDAAGLADLADKLCDGAKLPTDITKYGCGDGKNMKDAYARYFGGTMTPQKTCEKIDNGKQSLKIKVNLGVLGDKCKQVLNVGCSNGQVPGITPQILNIVGCVVANVGELTKDTGNVLQQTKEKNLLAAALLLVGVILQELMDALCNVDSQILLYGVLDALPSILLGTAGGLRATDESTAKLVASLVIILLIAIFALAPTLGGLVGAADTGSSGGGGLGDLVGGLLSLVTGLLSSLLGKLGGAGTAGGQAATELTGMVGDAKDALKPVADLVLGTLQPLTNLLLGVKATGCEGDAGLLGDALEPITDLAGSGSATLSSLSGLLQPVLEVLTPILGAVAAVGGALGKKGGRR